MKQILFSALIFFVLLVSCNTEVTKTETVAFSLDSAKAAIAASNSTYGSHFATGDSTAFLAHYTSDACISPSNMPKMCGAAAITAFFKGGAAMGIKNIKLTTDEVMGSQEAVVETGTYEILGDKEVTFDKGKFIVVWKQENGQWKMHRDIWNTDMPAAPVK